MHIVGLELMKLNLVTYLFMLVIYFLIPLIILTIIKIAYDDKNDMLMMMTFFIVLMIYLLLTKLFNVYKYADKMFSVRAVEIYYTNENLETLEINKDQIINDIVNGKIENNNKNLQVYKQTFQITYDEYNLLKPYEIQYDTLKNGNVKIIH